MSPTLRFSSEPPRIAPSRYRAARALLATSVLLAAACGSPADRQTWPLEVTAPSVGEIWVDGLQAVVDPLVPARLAVPTPPPFDVTFIGEDGPLTLLAVPGPHLDLRHFVGGPDPVRGSLVELQVQILDGPADVIGIAEGQVYRSAADGDLHRLVVPQSPELLLVGLWRADGRATHITRRPVPDAALAAERIVALAPDAPLDGSIALTVDGGPGGALTAELTERGLRTGLLLGSGRIDPGVAVAVPRPARPADDAGVWIRIEDGGAGRRARRTIEAALSLDADGAALRWSTTPGILPAARGPDAPAWFDAAGRTWSLTDVGDASWLELTIDGRGDCLGRPWRIIGPAVEQFTVPPAIGVDPLDAPLLDVRLTAVVVQGATLEGLMADGPPAVALPGRVTARRTASVDSVWRTDQADCTPHPLQGVYAIDGPGAVCDPTVAPPVAVVTRCGALAPLTDGTTVCGRFAADTFESVVHGRLAVDAEDGSARIEAPAGPIALFARPEPAARPPGDAVGDWSRFTLARQPLDGEGRATADSVVIESAVATPVATIELDGRITVRAEQWAFDARLIEADADSGRAEVHTAGCAARPPEVDLSWSGDRVEMVGEAVDGDSGRRWTLTLQR